MRLLLICLLCAVTLGFSQDNPVFGAPTNNLGLNGADEATMVLNLFNIQDQSKIEGVFYEFDDIRLSKVPTEGSAFLFDNWKQAGVIVVGDKRYVTNNINLNVSQDKFMTRLEEDSIFVFDFRGVDKILVSNRAFKSYYHAKEGRNRVFEVIYEGGEKSYLKAYRLEYVEGSVNPQLNRSRNKIKLKTDYFLMKDGVIESFKLKKSDILEQIDPGQRAALLAYVKQQSLSFKRESDLKQMLMHLERN